LGLALPYYLGSIEVVCVGKKDTYALALSPLPKQEENQSNTGTAKQPNDD
jgi:hypothetical protein